MKHPCRNECLGNFDLFSYLKGTAYDQELESIEQHLSDCDFCFEAFINVLNQFLDEVSVPTGSENAAAPVYQFA
jgi:hypothetical protein